MDRFLERYSLNMSDFRSLLIHSYGLLSGSTALALYLEQEGVAPGYEPGDLDIWFPSAHWASDSDSESASDLDSNCKERWTNFLVRSGYHMERDWVEEDHYMEYVTLIQRVMTFQREDKKIQLIVVDTEDLKKYMATRFDLSVCMTWWCVEQERFETIYPVLTRQKKMFIRRRIGISHWNLLRETERIQKYRERGFEVVEEPPPFYYLPDTRENVDVTPWKGVQVFDVWAYEEVDAADHLLGSDWNILVGCGSSWWAFDRRPLITYMEGRRVIDEIGIFYDTPYRQTVIHEAWDILAYSDYSIYRLVDGVEQTIGGTSKTVYVMEVYSTEGWRLGVMAEHIAQETMIRMDVEPAEPAEPAEQAENQLDENIEEQEVLLLLSEELNVNLPEVPYHASSSVSMTLAEVALYQEMMEWLDQA